LTKCDIRGIKLAGECGSPDKRGHLNNCSEAAFGGVEKENPQSVTAKKGIQLIGEQSGGDGKVSPEGTLLLQLRKGNKKRPKRGERREW